MPYLRTQSANIHTQKVLDQYFQLHPSKAIYWEEMEYLLIADAHFGKTTHFRQAGLPVPKRVIDDNYLRLTQLVQFYLPQKVLFLGDLFHSTLNEEWQTLGEWMIQFPNTSFELVLGNHDILPVDAYRQIQLTIHTEPYQIGDFSFSHHPLEKVEKSAFNFAGHVHPCVWLKGKGRQKLKLPCFYFDYQQCILPAFGAFTGMAAISPQEEDLVFVIAESKVIKKS